MRLHAWLASSFGLRTCQVGRLGIAVAIFQNGKNLSKERLFLHFNYQARLAQDREAVLKGEPPAYLQAPLVKSNILLGMHFKVPAKRNMNYRFQSAKQCGDCWMQQQIVLCRFSY